MKLNLFKLNFSQALLLTFFGLICNVLLAQMFPTTLTIPIIGTIATFYGTFSLLKATKETRGYTTYKEFFIKEYDVYILMFALNILAIKVFLPASDIFGFLAVSTIFLVLMFGKRNIILFNKKRSG